MSDAALQATADVMAVAISRLLKDGETVFYGLASPLVMVAVQVARRLHAPDLTFLCIPGAVNSNPAPRASTVDAGLLKGTPVIFTLADVFDLSARGDLDVAFLSGVQIDGRGAINMSAIGEHQAPTVRLPGGAGSALLLPTARRTILWRTRHDKRTFVDKLDFTTAAGNTSHVVTPLCVFERRDGRLQVASLHPGVTAEQVVANTGFAVTVGPDTPVTPAPTAAELAALAALDPAGVRCSEF